MGSRTSLPTCQTGLADPKTVEIVEQEGDIYLLRLDELGECIADTWHETTQAAKAQGSFEFGIEDGDWENLSADD